MLENTINRFWEMFSRIGKNMSVGTCSRCGKKDQELRPYGPGGSKICWNCGQDPEIKNEVQRRMREYIERGKE